jgi:hypothetical protein
MKHIIISVIVCVVSGCDEPNQNTTTTTDSSDNQTVVVDDCIEAVIRPTLGSTELYSCPKDTTVVPDKQPGYFLCKCKPSNIIKVDVTNVTK